MKNELYILIGMALVTYIPRMLPFVMMKDIKIPKRVDKFLSYIPFTMLSALIFPDVFTSTGNTYTAIAGLTVCIVAARYRIKPTWIIIISIITVFGFQTILY
ncbi:MAG: AzlD domain-containing protein [Eubacteriales bacterium]